MINALLVLIGLELGWKLIKHYYIKPKKIKMNLIKYSNPDIVRVEKLPDELYNQTIDDDLSNYPLYEKYYYKFCKIIESSVQREDLDNYFRNFKTLKVFSIDFKTKFSALMQGEILYGGYSPLDNSFDSNTSFYSNKINVETHELLHVSSTYFDKENKIIYCGFQQTFLKEDYDIEKKKGKRETYGLGINEGYTQYLNEKLFESSNKLSTTAYKNEKIIAKGLERIVGEDKLKSLYFRADLNGLVNELCKYNKKEDVYKFITITDILSVMDGDITRNISEMNEAKAFVGSFLINTIIKSIKEKLEFRQVAKLVKEYVPYIESNNISIIINEDSYVMIDMGQKSLLNDSDNIQKNNSMTNQQLRNR